MHSVETASTAAARMARAPSAHTQIRVQGKFFFAGQDKFFVKGVTYGPFGPGSHGTQFPEREIVAKDFTLMAGLGANTVRVFTVPPVWLLDMAEEIRVFIKENESKLKVKSE